MKVSCLCLQSYQITVEARDQGVPSLTSTTVARVTITDVNDNAPQFIHTPYNFSVRENTHIGTSVGTITATDDDIGIWYH